MEMVQKILTIYLLLINLIAFVVYGLDKHRAKKNRWRIPERTLLSLAVIGGSIGAFIGMYGFHHKTKHLKFVTGVPMILIIQLVIIYLYWNH